MFMFLKLSYFKIALIFEKAESFGNSWMSCDPFKVSMVSLAENLQKLLGWKEEEVFEELKALHSFEWRKSWIKVE